MLCNERIAEFEPVDDEMGVEVAPATSALCTWKLKIGTCHEGAAFVEAALKPEHPFEQASVNDYASEAIDCCCDHTLDELTII